MIPKDAVWWLSSTEVDAAVGGHTSGGTAGYAALASTSEESLQEPAGTLARSLC